MFSTFTTTFWEFLLQQAWCLVPNLAYYRDQILLRDERPRFHSKPRYDVRSPAGPQLIYNSIKTLRCRNCRTKSAALVTNF